MLVKGRPRRYGLAAFAAAVIIVVTACSKPAVGGKCSAGQSSCIDSSSGLFCGADGTWKSMTCAGAGGCKKAEGSKVTCDNDIAAVNDGCELPDDNACTADRRKFLQCKNQKFVLIDTCKGPGACRISGSTLFCDNDIADVGDPCSNEKFFACTSDSGMALQCNGGKYTLAQSCRGPKGCSIVHPKPKMPDIECDFTVASENDPCVFPGNEACSADRKTMYTCTGGKYTSPSACSGPAGCAVSVVKKVAKVSCDQGGNAPEPPKKKHHRR
jgi:hypothetical protein